MTVNSKRFFTDEQKRMYYPKSSSLSDISRSVEKRLKYLEKNHLKILRPANNDPIQFELNDDLLPLAGTNSSLHYIKAPETDTELVNKQYVDYKASEDIYLGDGNIYSEEDVTIKSDKAILLDANTTSTNALYGGKVNIIDTTTDLAQPSLELIGLYDGTSSPTLSLYNSRGGENGVNDDFCGQLYYYGQDTEGNRHAAARNYVKAKVATHDSYQGEVYLNTGGNAGLIDFYSQYLYADQAGLILGGSLTLTTIKSDDVQIVEKDGTAYTPANDASAATKKYVDEMKQTAVWGGTYPRTTGHDGKWLGIPTGHQSSVCILGTTEAAPDAAYDPDTSDTADELCGVIWQPLHSIKIINCRIYFAQGGGTNTRHLVCLMRYDIDGDGVLTSGVEVAGPDADSGIDDSATLAFKIVKGSVVLPSSNFI